MTRPLTTTCVRAVLGATAAAAMTAATLVSGPANAAPSDGRAPSALAPGAECASPRVALPTVSFQLFSARAWIAQDGLEAVLAELSRIGYREVQPYAATYNLPDGEFEALLTKYRLRASSGQSAYTEDTFDDFLDSASAFGHRYTGSGGFGQPGIARDGSSTFADALATAEQMNRLGERSVANGTGKLFGHNHNWEFETQVTDPDTGETMSAWEAIVENTDPRWVTFEVDVFWAEYAGVDVAELLEGEHADRIELLHVKDASPVEGGTAAQTSVGAGDIDWTPILRAARGTVRYYVVETDLTPTDGDFARESFQYLTCR